jgi:hypothetical protein
MAVGSIFLDGFSSAGHRTGLPSTPLLVVTDRTRDRLRVRPLHKKACCAVPLFPMFHVKRRSIGCDVDEGVLTGRGARKLSFGSAATACSSFPGKRGMCSTSNSEWAPWKHHGGLGNRGFRVSAFQGCCASNEGDGDRRRLAAAGKLPVLTEGAAQKA